MTYTRAVMGKVRADLDTQELPNVNCTFGSCYSRKTAGRPIANIPVLTALQILLLT
jgi:hypothetical protein